MRRHVITSFLVPGLALLVTACQTPETARMESDASTVSSESEQAMDFIGALTSHFDVDYDAFMSPAAAVEAADPVVLGRVSSVAEGVSIFSPEGLWEQRTTVIVDVEEVISGRAASEEINLQIARSPIVGLDELSENLPAGQALFILEDLTGWHPSDEARFEYPDGLDEATTVYSPYPDGMWFATELSPIGYFASFEEIEFRWDGVSDFETLVGAFKVAASASN